MIMKLWIYENHVWELRGEEVYNAPIQQPAVSWFVTCSSVILVECCSCIIEVKGSNLVQAWIFSGFLSTTAKAVACITGASWPNWSEWSILREVRNECEAWDEGRRKIKCLLCMVQFYLLPSPPPASPGNPQDRSSPSGPGVGNCLKQSCPGGRGFSLILWSRCYFSHSLDDGCWPQDCTFLGKNAGIWRRVVGEE